MILVVLSNVTIVCAVTTNSSEIPGILGTKNVISATKDNYQTAQTNSKINLLNDNVKDAIDNVKNGKTTIANSINSQITTNYSNGNTFNELADGIASVGINRYNQGVIDGKKNMKIEIKPTEIGMFRSVWPDNVYYQNGIYFAGGSTRTASGGDYSAYSAFASRYGLPLIRPDAPDGWMSALLSRSYQIVDRNNSSLTTNSDKFVGGLIETIDISPASMLREGSDNSWDYVAVTYDCGTDKALNIVKDALNGMVSKESYHYVLNLSGEYDFQGEFHLISEGDGIMHIVMSYKSRLQGYMTSGIPEYGISYSTFLNDHYQRLLPFNFNGNCLSANGSSVILLYSK